MDLKSRFPNLQVDTDSILARARFAHQGARAELYTQGAHLAAFQTQSRDSLLWVSSDSYFETGKPIRGGVPLVFPWFGPNKAAPHLPAHGFARTMEWQIIDDQEGSIMLALASNEKTLAIWPHQFELLLGVVIQAEKLRLTLHIHNTGDSAFLFETALHTYLSVSDPQKILIEGLEGKTYLDKVDGGARKTQSGPIRIEGETDRVYLDSPGPITLRDGARTVTVTNRGGVKSTVVWNPWIDKARALADLGDDEWQRFVCIESGVIADDAQKVQARESYEMTVEIGVEGGNDKNGATS